MTSQDRAVRNGDLTLHALVDGDDGAAPIVLLHGITASVRTWDWLVPHLAADHRVIRLDFRGHGRSDRAPGGYDMQGYVSDAASACRAAGAPCIVVGHSLGGATAVGLAQLHPDLVRAVVLEEPPIGVPRSLEGNTLADAFRVMHEAVPRLQAQGVPADVLAGTMAAAPSATGPTFGELLHPDALAAMAVGLLELDASVLDGIVSGTPPAPAYDRDRPIAAPALLIAADPARPDCVTRAEDAEQFARVNPAATVLTVAGAGHLVHDELAHRDAFLAAVLEFVAAV